VLPLIAAIVMGAAAYGVYTGLYALIKSNVITLILAIITGAAVYAVLVLKLKVLDRNDILAMPKGSKLVKVLEKVHLV
jgi:stage V sporulation protein B